MKAGRGRLDREQAGARFRACGDQDQLDSGSVDHVGLMSLEAPLAVHSPGARFDIRQIRATVIFGDRQCAAQFAGGDAWWIVLLGSRVVAGGEEFAGEHDAGKGWGAEQTSPSLL